MYTIADPGLASRSAGWSSLVTVAPARRFTSSTSSQESSSMSVTGTGPPDAGRVDQAADGAELRPASAGPRPSTCRPGHVDLEADRAHAVLVAAAAAAAGPRRRRGPVATAASDLGQRQSGGQPDPRGAAGDDHPRGGRGPLRWPAGTPRGAPAGPRRRRRRTAPARSAARGRRVEAGEVGAVGTLLSSAAMTSPSRLTARVGPGMLMERMDRRGGPPNVPLQPIDHDRGDRLGDRAGERPIRRSRSRSPDRTCPSRNRRARWWR